jgi:hypothetical protein
MASLRTVKRKAYGISRAARQGLFVPNRRQCGAPYLLAVQVDLFKIKGLEGDICTWAQCYPQKVWGTHPEDLCTAVKAGRHRFPVPNQRLSH